MSSTASPNEHSSSDEALIDRALAIADLNALRMALYQLTNDPALEPIELERVPIRGGASWAHVPASKHHAEIRAKARAMLIRGNAVEQPTSSVSDRQLRDWMEMMIGGTRLNDQEFLFHKEQYGLEKFPRAARWTTGRPAMIPEGFMVGIIGAGPNGIAAAVQLEQLGVPYVIYERGDSAGGTWRINTFPDARVDTSSFIYQFSFEKRYPWSEYFARQDEVHRYFVHVAQKFNITPKIRFNTDVTAATFEPSSNTWVLRLADGSTHRVNVLIAASGLFNKPNFPDIAGLDDYTGHLLHSTEWTHDIDVRGKRIAVVGNGSTGIQIMPGVAASGAARVSTFQRTPQWISPLERYGEAIPDETRWLLKHMPYYWNWYCYSMVRATFIQQDAQVVDPAWQARGGLIGERNDKLREIMTRYVHEQLKDRPDLIPKVLPDYPPLARRLVVDNGWYKALLRDNVELVTTEIERFTSNGIRTVDGEEREFDIIALATGFTTEKYLWPISVTGRDGAVLEDTWHGDPRAYLGMTVPQFPNLFIMYGPNSQSRAGSLICWFEVWSQHAAAAVVTLLERGAQHIEVKSTAFEEYNRELDAANAILVWRLGPRGRNYYVNAKGRPQVNCPLRIEDYRARFLRPFDEAYHIS